MSKTILAVGAAGKFAGLVVPALVAHGAQVRGLIRKPEQAEEVRRRGAAEIAIGNLSDEASLRRAMDGVDAIFYLAPAFLADEAEVGARVVATAMQAGVRRLVFSSVIHPALGSLVNHAAKVPVEEAILGSGLEYAFLHPAVFYQNYAQSWPKVVKTGVLAEPWSNDTRFSRVDYRDVAETAALALTDDRLLNGTFELCAQGTLDRHEVAALMSDVLGREVKAQRRDPATLKVPAALRRMFEHYEHHGLLGSPVTLRAHPGPRAAYPARLFRGTCRNRSSHGMSSVDQGVEAGIHVAYKVART